MQLSFMDPECHTSQPQEKIVELFELLVLVTLFSSLVELLIDTLSTRRRNSLCYVYHSRRSRVWPISR